MFSIAAIKRMVRQRRLLYGVSVVPLILQQCVDLMFGAIGSVITYLDDILQPIISKRNKGLWRS